MPDAQAEGLAVFLKRLIASEKGLKNYQEVTPDYIQKQRDENIYPHVRYENGCSYRGYSGDGLQFYTWDEFAEIERLLDMAMATL